MKLLFGTKEISNYCFGKKEELSCGLKFILFPSYGNVCLHGCLSTTCSHGAHGVQKRTLVFLLELELQTVLRPHVGARKLTHVLWKNSNCF